MTSRRTTYLRLLSVLIASAASPVLAGGCGGTTTGDGTAGSSGSSGVPIGSSGGDSTDVANPPGCYPAKSETLTVVSTLCQPQLEGTNSCGDNVCAWTVALPCTPDGDDAGAGDAGADAATDAATTDSREACLELCNAARPPGKPATTSCVMRPVDESGAKGAYCGACGAGRPPRGFVARHASAPNDAAERLAQMAQLEAASVEAFYALHADLSRLGAPRSLLEAVVLAAADEVRHAHAVARAAESFGARVPEIAIAAARPRSLVELAIENAEEGCVKETFGAALAAMQAATASDERVRCMMHGIARDELGHAALSWQLDAWFAERLDAAGRARVANARREAVRTLEAELTSDDAGSRELGLPGSARARQMLDAMREVLETGNLALERAA